MQAGVLTGLRFDRESSTEKQALKTPEGQLLQCLREIKKRTEFNSNTFMDPVLI